MYPELYTPAGKATQTQVQQEHAKHQVSTSQGGPTAPNEIITRLHQHTFRVLTGLVLPGFSVIASQTTNRRPGLNCTTICHMAGFEGMAMSSYATKEKRLNINFSSTQPTWICLSCF
jgi:hypothetical protein